MKRELINYKALGVLFLEFRKNNGYTRQNIVDKVKRFSEDSTFSLSTLQRIEGGTPIKNFKKYHMLARIYDVSYEQYRLPYITVNSYIDEVVKSINIISISEYETLRKKIEHFYNLHRNSIYISQMALLCLTCLDTFLYNCSTINKSILPLLDNSEVLDGNAKVITDFLLYRSSFKYRDYNRFQKYFSKGRFLDGENIFYLDMLCYDVKVLSKLEMYKKYNNLLAERNNCDKPVYIFALLASLSYIEMIFGEYELSYKHLQAAMKIEMIDKYLPKIYLDLMLNFFGILAYKAGNFKEVITHLLELRNIDKNLLGQNYITLFDSLFKLDKKKDVIQIINEDEQNMKDKILIDVFKYYKEKSCLNRLNLLENMINNTIIKYKFNSDIYSKVFINELKTIVEETKHYKLYYVSSNIHEEIQDYMLRFESLEY